MATINSENAKQIRNPMQIYIHLLAGASGTITGFNVPAAPIKSYDSSLKNTTWAMRSIADLAGDGFPLDGSVEWFDSSMTPSEANGKLGLRGNTGANVNVSFTASSSIASVTVASQNVDTITVDGVSYPSTGLNVIPINAASATLQFTLIDSDERIMIDYIIPGAEFSITNDNLVSCNLALRSDLSVQNHTWEESEIEVSMYYPYDISSTFAYIQSDFPITYQAGYDSDLSEIRRFYLSEPITEENHVITIRGVDASHWLETKTMREQWIESTRGKAHDAIYYAFIDAIKSAGISLVHTSIGAPPSTSSITDVAILPEMSVRDFVANVMNLTLNHKRNGTAYGIQFVDAGIPTVEFGDGTIFGKTWTINKSDCADWVESYEQNISLIRDTSDEHNFNEHAAYGTKSTARVLFGTIETNTLPPSTNDSGAYTATKAGQIVELNFDGFMSNIIEEGITPIVKTPTSYYGRITRDSSLVTNQPSGGIPPAYKYTAVNYARITGRMASITGGVKSFSNPNGLPGITIDFDPVLYGSLYDANGEAIMNYPSLFNRSIRTGSFTFKGDPRYQPLDYLIINNDTNDGRGNITARITSIDLSHEGGGTTATIGWREWS